MQKIILILSFLLLSLSCIVAQDKESDLKELRKYIAENSEGMFWFDYDECSPNTINFYYRGASYETKITSLDTCYYEVYKRNKDKYAWVVIETKDGAPIISLKPESSNDFIISGFGFTSYDNGIDFKSRIYLKMALDKSKTFIDKVNALIENYGKL